MMNETISNEFAPVAQLHFKGTLVALLSLSGVVLYSTPRGDKALGSTRSIRGYNLKHFLCTDLDTKTMESFLNRLQSEEQKEDEESEQENTVMAAMWSRTGSIVTIHPCDTYETDAPIANIPMKKIKKVNWDEDMSFDDAFL